ncbi:VanZ like protein [Hydrogenivirga caldilitoris]|uniref:VanZ like protein n=1 Tax=Hydrogenivirga caldilitoris TaxID=246264 RepID=A0A497XQ77_9AQUI|nr:VanZ family protein [Hydrogenivirga caldilitoris]RLJ70441.1 VanZ like protein [Hydrogenivirga caldilitoris]
MSSKKLWIIITLYIVFIYTTLPLARLFLNALYNTLGKTTLSLFTNLVLAGIFFYVVLKLYRRKGKRALIYTLAGTLLLGFIVTSLERPEERIHFLEYGVLGFLFVKAFNSTDFRALTVSVLLASGVGVLDEVIQGFLPNRVGDIRDAFMNVAGGFLGVWFARFYYS